MTRVAGVVLLLFAALVAPACSVVAPREVGSGHVVADQRDISGFTRVRVAAAIRATIIVGPAESVTVRIDDNLLANVKTDVTAGRLDVTMSGNAQPTTPVEVDISLPNLEGLEVNSAASATATGINTASFQAEADSAGSLTARGNADSVDVSASSAGSADLGDIPAQSAKVNVDSAGRVTVNAQQSVTGSADSGGVVHIEGSPPSVTVSTDSGGQVIRD